jgi:hypothetical protein
MRYKVGLLLVYILYISIIVNLRETKVYWCPLISLINSFYNWLTLAVFLGKS